MFAKSRSWIRCVSLCVCLCVCVCALAIKISWTVVYTQLYERVPLFVQQQLRLRLWLQFDLLHKLFSGSVGLFVPLQQLRPGLSCCFSPPLPFHCLLFLFEIYIVHTMSCTKCKSEETIKRKQLISCFCCCFLFQLICVQIRSLFVWNLLHKKANQSMQILCHFTLIYLCYICIRAFHKACKVVHTYYHNYYYFL